MLPNVQTNCLFLEQKIYSAIFAIKSSISTKRLHKLLKHQKKEKGTINDGIKQYSDLISETSDQRY
jgi:hypothetical protein